MLRKSRAPASLFTDPERIKRVPQIPERSKIFEIECVASFGQITAARRVLVIVAL